MAIGKPFVTNRTEINTIKSSWITYPKPNPQAKLRLYCFPYAGAGASVFHEWAYIFPDTFEICPVQFPGRENRLAEPPIAQFKVLVKAAAEALLPYLDRPFAFFGHSMGALISFYLARTFSTLYDIVPLHLFVSGHNAPQITDNRKPIHSLPEPEFIEEICNLNGMPKEVLAHAELMELLLPILRADFTVAETYDYQPAKLLECPITAMGGLQDKFVSRENLEAWREQTSTSFMAHMFPGDHFYLNHNRELLLQLLARQLTKYL